MAGKSAYGRGYDLLCTVRLHYTEHTGNSAGQCSGPYYEA